MLELIGGYIIAVIENTGYFGIFLLMALESALIPIPSEITMPFAGFLAAQGKLSIIAVVLAGAIGNLAGSLAAYWLGFWGQEAVVRKLIRRFGKYILVTEEEYDKGERWFKKHGDSIAFFSRLLPAVRTFISLPLGVAKVDLGRFLFYTFTGSLIWSAFLTYIGVILQDNWVNIEHYFRQFEIVLAVLGVLLVLFYVNHKLKLVKFF